MSRRSLLLINRNARHGIDVGEQASAKLRAEGLEIVEGNLSKSTSGTDLIRQHRTRITDVIVGGGDGTLNAAARGLLEAKLPFGILPLGTANDLARTLEIPANLDEACKVVARGHTRRIDLGCVNGQYFFNAASLGLSVEIAQKLTKEEKGRWGVFAYVVALVRVLRYARPFRAEIRSGGDRHRVRTLQITVGNGRHYGGGLTVGEACQIDDGSLSLHSLEVGHWWQLIKLVFALRSGKFAEWREVRTLNGPEFIITPRWPRHVNTDGEVTTRTPAKFWVLPKAMEVYVPETATSAA